MPNNPVGGLISRLKAGLSRADKTAGRSGVGDVTVDDPSPASTGQGGDGSPGISTAGSGEAGSIAPPPPITSQSPPPRSRDILALAISDISAHFHKPIVSQTLSAGLPLVGGVLPLEHVELACARAGLSCTRERMDVRKLCEQELPAIVVLDDKTVEVLWGFEGWLKRKPARAVMSVPGRPDSRVTIPVRELKAICVEVIKLRPFEGLDSRGKAALEVSAKNWFLPAFRASRKIYSEAIVATVAINLLGLAVPLFSMNVYDRVLPNAAEATLWALAIGVMIAIAFDNMLRNMRAYFVDAASRRADVQLSNLIFGRLLGARLATKQSSVGVRANTMREFETLREFINSATLSAFGDLPFLLLFLGVMWIVAGPLALVVIAVIPIILGIGWLTQRSLDKLIQESFRDAAQKNAVVVETLSGLESIKAGGGESWAANKWERAVAEHVRNGIKIRNVTNLGQHAIHGIQTLVQVLIVVVGFYLVAQGQMTMGALIAATILSGRALQPLAQAANLLARLNQTRIAYRTLSDIVLAEQERPIGGKFLAKAAFEGDIAFENVTFSYDEEAAPALREFSLSIKAGERVAIIGGIGSGKTTALKLLQCLHIPTDGRVLIDGVAASQIEPSLLRANVGLALQGGELFHGSIRENITISDPAAPDDAVIQAARAAGALDWIARLPQGFDMAVGERGGGLSGGQRQTVALARALLRQPKIIALDEPTSDMDGRTEQLVISRLAAWVRGRTLILVTHRPALLALVDRLVVIEAGRKVEDGPKDEVLAALRARASVRPQRVAPAGAATGGSADANGLPGATGVAAASRVTGGVR